MSEHSFDVVVIGSGPAGEGAAMNAAKHQKKVAVVERYRGSGRRPARIGHQFPASAALRGEDLHEVRNNPLLRDARSALN